MERRTSIRPSTNISTNHSTGQFKTVLRLMKTTIEEDWNFHRTGFPADVLKYDYVQARNSQLWFLFSSTYCHLTRPYLEPF